MATNKQKLEAALAAIDRMTDAEYLALHEEAKKYTGPDIVIPDLMPEPEIHLNLNSSVSAVAVWSESTANIYISGDANFAMDNGLSLVA